MTRPGHVRLAAVAVLAIAVAAVVPLPLKLVWNASSSVPIGFYTIESAGRFENTELVAVAPPEPVARFMVERRYIGPKVPLLKRVAALPGQIVCRAGRAISVDGQTLGFALERDRMGRPLPVWSGCRRLAPGEIFLMNWTAGASFDGRYFGPLPARAIIGRAVPLYTDEHGDGRFVWRAGAATARP